VCLESPSFIIRLQIKNQKPAMTSDLSRHQVAGLRRPCTESPQPKPTAFQKDLRALAVGRFEKDETMERDFPVRHAKTQGKVQIHRYS
jgi:hypothetical protein